MYDVNYLPVLGGEYSPHAYADATNTASGSYYPGYSESLGNLPYMPPDMLPSSSAAQNAPHTEFNYTTWNPEPPKPASSGFMQTDFNRTDKGVIISDVELAVSNVTDLGIMFKVGDSIAKLVAQTRSVKASDIEGLLGWFVGISSFIMRQRRELGILTYVDIVYAFDIISDRLKPTIPRATTGGPGENRLLFDGYIAQFNADSQKFFPAYPDASTRASPPVTTGPKAKGRVAEKRGASDVTTLTSRELFFDKTSLVDRHVLHDLMQISLSPLTPADFAASKISELSVCIQVSTDLAQKSLSQVISDSETGRHLTDLYASYLLFWFHKSLCNRVGELLSSLDTENVVRPILQSLARLHTMAESLRAWQTEAVRLASTGRSTKILKDIKARRSNTGKQNEGNGLFRSLWDSHIEQNKPKTGGNKTNRGN